MGFFSDMFNRAGRVARGQANQSMSVIEDATFEATVNQTVADMKTELNNVVRASAMAMSNYNQLDSEYQKYVKQAQEWKARAGQALKQIENFFASLEGIHQRRTARAHLLNEKANGRRVILHARKLAYNHAKILRALRDLLARVQAGGPLIKE